MKISKILFAVIVALSLVQGSVAFAQSSLQPNCDATLPVGQPGSCDAGAAVSFVKRLIDLMFYIAIPLAAIFIGYGGFVMMTAAGNPGKFDDGKKIMTATVIGIAIAFGAWLIVTALNAFIAGPFQFK